MATFTMDMPPQLQGDEHDAQQLRQYLVRLVDRLLYCLNNLDSENLVEGGISVGKIRGGGAAVLASAAEQQGKAGGAVTASWLRAQVAEIVTAVIRTAVIDWAHIASLEAEVAEIAQASIGTATIDWAQLNHLTAEEAIVARYLGERMYIDRLSVTAAQMVDLTVGNLCIRANDGRYYLLDVDPLTGRVTARETTVTAGEIAAGATSSGQHIIETDLTVQDLYAGTVQAQEALIGKIAAQRIDADQLFARQAVIDALTTGSIAAALGQSLNLSSNVSIASVVQRETEGISTHFVVEDGMIRVFLEDDGESYELQLTETEMRFVNQDTGQALARFSIGDTETDALRSRDRLSVGRTDSGWYDMTVLETGIADKWRDGTDSAVRPCVITREPTDSIIEMESGSHPTTGTGSWQETFTFTCTAEEAQSYQWQVRPRREGSTWNNSSTGSTLTLAMTPERLGREYRCKVTGLDGSVLYSRTVRPRVKGAPTAYGSAIIGADSVTQQYRTGNTSSGDWTNSSPGSGTQYCRWLLTAAGGQVSVTDEKVVEA